MGRYYSTSNFYGKFGFGTQPSTDPEIFGMSEDTSVIHYYLYDDGDALDEVKRVIDIQYDILAVPKDERKYLFVNDDQVDDYVMSLNKYVFREVDEDENKKGLDLYYLGDSKDWTPLSNDFVLARDRIALGVVIYSELHHNGQCFLEAEC